MSSGDIYDISQKDLAISHVAIDPLAVSHCAPDPLHSCSRVQPSLRIIESIMLHRNLFSDAKIFRH